MKVPSRETFRNSASVSAFGAPRADPASLSGSIESRCLVECPSGPLPPPPVTMHKTCAVVAPQPAFAAEFEARLLGQGGRGAMPVDGAVPRAPLAAGSAAPPVKCTPLSRDDPGVCLKTEAAESRVLVLYTGGTLGMMRNERNVLAPVPNALIRTLKNNPFMHDKNYFSKSGRKNLEESDTLVLPDVNEKNRIMYTIIEYNPLLDSSNMSVHNWVQIGEDLRKNYNKYHGFVVLHGTDTLSYTASALSFMLENLGKTVIITGAQIPIYEVRSDGRDNFLGAVILAGNYVIPEVCVYFDSKLYRGNRTTKVSSECLNAFDSLNFSPLATLGVNIEVYHMNIFRQCAIERFRLHSKVNRNVGLLRLFPSITAETVSAFLQPPTQGVVLQSYGSGNVPSDRKDILDAIRAATQRGVIVVNTTQCSRGSVCNLYATGDVLRAVGVTPGFDMTPEAALTKLSYVLGKDDWDIDTKRKMMQQNLRGELTPELSGEGVKEWELVDAVARCLQVTSYKEREKLGSILFPAIVNSAVLQASIPKLNSLEKYGVDLTVANSDGRTCLHVACCEGNPEIVEHLLLRGANVHMTDRFHHTPLLDAIEFDHHEVIKLLVQCGAHIVAQSHNIGEKLCSAASLGMLKRLISFQLAGADLNQPDISGFTALHMAVLHNHEDVVQFLLDSKANPNVSDMIGNTPLSIADAKGLHNIKKLLQSAAL